MGFWTKPKKKTPAQIKRERAEKKLRQAELHFGLKAGKVNTAYGKKEKDRTQKEFHHAMDLWEQAAAELAKLK